MENTFLQKLSKEICNIDSDLQNIMIVLPSRRAQRMLMKALGAQLNKPSFAPTIYTIEELVALLSPLKKLDQLELLSDLYCCAKNMNMPKNQDFNQFLSWGPTFLNDISDLDVQMQSAEGKFLELSNSKDFETRLGKDELSESDKETIAFFSKLENLYIQFKKFLLDKKCGYDGLLFRDCAENIADYVAKLPAQKVVFAGFHVLSDSELQIVKYIKEKRETHFFFDLDPFYCDFDKQDKHTTAYFLKRICTALSLDPQSLQFKEEHYKNTLPQKEIHLVGASKTMAQIYYAIDQLEVIRKNQGNLDDTALVLADEALLLPFLSAYHDPDMNVTMGYPFRATVTYTLLQTLMDAYQIGYQYYEEGNNHTEFSFTHPNLMAILRNPLVKSALSANRVDAYKVVNAYEKNQSFQFATEEIKEIKLPHYSSKTEDMLPQTIDFLQRILSAMDDDDQSEQLNMLVEQLEIARDFVQSMMMKNQQLNFFTIKYIVGQLVDKLTLPLRGDATKGLQVMGLLETRMLDFKNVIILSVNEGVLPAGIKFNSLIPFDIKYQNQEIENYLYKDQVYAYHFFRLLQRAENVILLYDNDTKDSLKEKSRFVTQLEFEVTNQKLQNVKITKSTVEFPISNEMPEISVEKTDEILQKLRDFEYSASTINQYVACPLQFYFSNVCRLYKQESFNDKIESAVTGTISHKIFEDCFNEIKKRQAQGENYASYKSVIDDYIRNLETKIQDKMKEKMKQDKSLNLQDKDFERGRVFLATQVIKNDVENYLEKAQIELAKDTIEILANEKKVSFDLSIDSGEQFHFKGSIDRLQRITVNSWSEDGTEITPVKRLQVVDYKTGKVEPKNLELSLLEFESVIQDTKYYQLLQLLMYALFCKNSQKPEGVLDANGKEKMKPEFTEDELKDISCGLISTICVNKKSDPYFLMAKVGEQKPESESLKNDKWDVIERFEELLKKLMTEIYNKEKAFTQCEDTKICKRCDYKYICGRGLVNQNQEF